MDDTLAAYITFGALIVYSLFLWGKGLLKGRRDDLIAGLGVPMTATLVLAALTPASPYPINALGHVLMLLGLYTLMLSAFAKRGCLWTRADRIKFGLGALVLGFLVSLAMC